MDTNSFFSAVSFLAVLIYIYIGIYTYQQKTKSMIHRIFLLLCMSYAIWSFAYAFAYLASNPYVFSVWNKISAIGWCSFSALSLYLVLLITEQPILKNKWVAIIIFMPAILFFGMAVFLFGPDIQTPKSISDFFYLGDFIYDFSYLLLSIIIVFLWGHHTNELRIKKQAKVIVYSSVIPFILNLLTQHILPIFGINHFPLMGQLYALILIIGIYIVITKYKFLRYPERFIIEEIINEMMDMVIILDSKGKIIRISTNTLELLGYENREVLHEPGEMLLEDSSKAIIAKANLKLENQKLHDLQLLKKNGDAIPVNISTSPIIDANIHDLLGTILVIQDIRTINELKRINQSLQERAIRDGLTQLYNHQYSIELINQEVQKIKIEKEYTDLSIMMLDIDYFKAVNDNYGHPFGDYVLETISAILLEITGPSNFVGRFGGEEFIIILPRTNVNDAYHIAEKLRNKIGTYPFEENLKLTVSIGVSQLDEESTVQLIKKADDLLYRAKLLGRNRVEI